MLSLKSSKKQVWAHCAKKISEDSHLRLLEVSSVLENDDHSAMFGTAGAEKRANGGGGSLGNWSSMILLVLFTAERSAEKKISGKPTRY